MPQLIMSSRVGGVLRLLLKSMSLFDRMQLAPMFKGDYEIAQIKLDCHKYRLSQFASNFVLNYKNLSEEEATADEILQTIESILPELNDTLDLSSRSRLYERKAMQTRRPSKPCSRILDRMANHLHLFLEDFMQYHQKFVDFRILEYQDPWYIFTDTQLAVELEIVLDQILGMEEAYDRAPMDDFITSLFWASKDHVRCEKDWSILGIMVHTAMHENGLAPSKRQEHFIKRFKPYWPLGTRILGDTIKGYLREEIVEEFKCTEDERIENEVTKDESLKETFSRVTLQIAEPLVDVAHQEKTEGIEILVLALDNKR